MIISYTSRKMESTTVQYTFIYHFEGDENEKIRELLILLGQKVSWCSVQLKAGLICVNTKEEEKEIIQYIGPMQHLSNRHNSEIVDYWINKETIQLESLQGSGWSYRGFSFKMLFVCIYQHDIFVMPRGYIKKIARPTNRELLLQNEFKSVTEQLMAVRWKKQKYQVKEILEEFSLCREFQKKIYLYFVLNERKYDAKGHKLPEHAEINAWFSKYKDEENLMKKFADSENKCFVQCLTMPFAKPINCIGNSKRKQLFYAISDSGEYLAYSPKKKIKNDIIIYCPECDSLHIAKHKCPRQKEIKLNSRRFGSNYNNIDLMEENSLSPERVNIKRKKFYGSYDCETRADSNNIQTLSCICAALPDWRDKKLKWICSRTLDNFLSKIVELCSGEPLFGTNSRLICNNCSCSQRAELRWHDFEEDCELLLCSEHYKGTFQQIQLFAHNGASFDSHIVLKHWRECADWLLTQVKCKNSMKYNELEFRRADALNIVLCLRDSMKYSTSSLDSFSRSMNVAQRVESGGCLNPYFLPMTKIDFPMFDENRAAIESGSLDLEAYFGALYSELVDCAYAADVLLGGEPRGLLCFHNYWNQLDLRQQFDLLEVVYCGSDCFILLAALQQLATETWTFTSLTVAEPRVLRKFYYDDNTSEYVERKIRIQAGNYEGIDIIRYYSLPSASLAFVKLYNLLHEDCGDLRGFENCRSADRYEETARALRGGLSTPFYRYAHYSKGPILNPDVNGLYSYCMTKPMPNVFVGSYNIDSLQQLPTQLQDTTAFIFGFLCDISYPENLRSDPKHLAFPLLFHHMEIGEAKRLVTSMLPQKNYYCSSALFDFYRRNGLECSIKRVDVYTSEKCLSSALTFLNAQQMQAVQNNDKPRAQIFKFIKNSLFGKMCENTANHPTFKLNSNATHVRSDQFSHLNSFAAPTLQSSYSFKLNSDFSNPVVLPTRTSFYGRNNSYFNTASPNSQIIQWQQNAQVDLLKQISGTRNVAASNIRGMFILDYAKIHLSEFAHALAEAFGSSAIRNLYVDTDGFQLQWTEAPESAEFPRYQQAQFIKELKRRLPHMMDISYTEQIANQFCHIMSGEDITETDFVLQSPNKKVGLWSLDLQPGEILQQFVGLGSKSYAVLSSHRNICKQKGLSKKALIRSTNQPVSFDDFLQAYSTEEVQPSTIPNYFRKSSSGIDIGVVSRNSIQLARYPKFKYSGKFYNERYHPYI